VKYNRSVPTTAAMLTSTSPDVPAPPAEATTALRAVAVDHPTVATGTVEITTEGVRS